MITLVPTIKRDSCGIAAVVAAEGVPCGRTLLRCLETLALPPPPIPPFRPSLWPPLLLRPLLPPTNGKLADGLRDARRAELGGSASLAPDAGIAAADGLDFGLVVTGALAVGAMPRAWLCPRILEERIASSSLFGSSSTRVRLRPAIDSWGTIDPTATMHPTLTLDRVCEG